MLLINDDLTLNLVSSSSHLVTNGANGFDGLAKLASPAVSG